MLYNIYLYIITLYNFSTYQETLLRGISTLFNKIPLK